MISKFCHTISQIDVVAMWISASAVGGPDLTEAYGEHVGRAWGAGQKCASMATSRVVLEIHNRRCHVSWLVVWNMAFILPYIGNNDPNWQYFSEGLKPPTSWYILVILGLKKRGRIHKKPTLDFAIAGFWKSPVTMILVVFQLSLSLSIWFRFGEPPQNHQENNQKGGYYGYV